MYNQALMRGAGTDVSEQRTRARRKPATSEADLAAESALWKLRCIRGTRQAH
jgi:hypothetical protein